MILHGIKLQQQIHAKSSTIEIEKVINHYLDSGLHQKKKVFCANYGK